jgi:hypothetical protein
VTWQQRAREYQLVRLDAALRYYHAQGLTLAECCDAKHLNLRPSTLMPHIRRLRLSFPDYTPLVVRMRVKEGDKP